MSVKLSDYTQEDTDYYHSLTTTVVYDADEKRYYAEVHDAEGFTIAETDFWKSKFEAFQQSERLIWEKLRERVLQRKGGAA